MRAETKVIFVQETRRRGGPESARSEQVAKVHVRPMWICGYAPTCETVKTCEPSKTSGSSNCTDDVDSNDMSDRTALIQVVCCGVA